MLGFESATAVVAEDTQNIMSSAKKPNIKFDSIIGVENAKNELRFFIEYLKEPKIFVESGLKAPKRALLFGSPGTGKTMLAKAVAAEAGVTFISAEGNQLIKKITDRVLDEVFETFAGSEEKVWDVSQLERTARHEAGRTFLCRHSGETPSYVTIVARGDHGGCTLHDVNEGKQIYTKAECR